MAALEITIKLFGATYSDSQDVPIFCERKDKEAPRHIAMSSAAAGGVYEDLLLR